MRRGGGWARRLALAELGLQLLLTAVCSYMSRFLGASHAVARARTTCTCECAELSFHVAELVYLGPLLLASAAMLVAVRSLATSTGVTEALLLALECTAHASPAMLPFRFVVCKLMTLHQMAVDVVPPVLRLATPRGCARARPVRARRARGAVPRADR